MWQSQMLFAHGRQSLGTYVLENEAMSLCAETLYGQELLIVEWMQTLTFVTAVSCLQRGNRGEG